MRTRRANLGVIAALGVAARDRAGRPDKKRQCGGAGYDKASCVSSEGGGRRTRDHHDSGAGVVRDDVGFDGEASERALPLL